MKKLVFSIIFLLFGAACLTSCNMHSDPIEDLVVQKDGGGASGGGGSKPEPD